MSNVHVSVPGRATFYIQDSTLLAYGFELTEFEEGNPTGYYRNKVFDKRVNRLVVLSVSYTYALTDHGYWQLTHSRVDLIADGVEIPTHACCIADLQQLYRMISGNELTVKGDG